MKALLVHRAPPQLTSTLPTGILSHMTETLKWLGAFGLFIGLAVVGMVFYGAH